MFKVIKKQKRKRLLVLFFELIVGLGIYGFVLYNNLFMGGNFHYSHELFLGYVLFVFVIHVLSSIGLFSAFDSEVRKNHQNINFLLGADIAEGYRYSQLAMIYFDPEDHTILWTSELFEERFIQAVGLNLLEWQPAFSELINSEDDKKEIIISLEKRKYSAIYLKELHIILLKDVTELETIKHTRSEQAPLIMTLIIDNYQDLNTISNESVLAEIENEARKVIAEWAKKYSLVIRRYKDDAYIAFLNEETYEKIKNDEFQIISKIKNVNGNNDFHLTLSIGIGRGNHDLKVLAELSNAALDVALSRGGDQVVINNYGQNMEFFGGKTNSKVKRSVVKARNFAQSFTTHILRYQTILIMGHIASDLDAVGACLGVYAFAKNFNKEAYIIWDDKLVEKKARLAMHGQFAKQEFDQITISQQQATSKFGPNTLLVVCDCHSPNMCLYPNAVDKSENIAIIDHHRKSENAIEDPIFSYHEPQSSSACELICDLIKYSNYSFKIDSRIATIMLSGILLDTNYFRRQTGIRTFEASAVLKDFQADNIEADNFLKDDYEEFLLKTKIMNNMETVSYGVIIAVASNDDIIDQTILAKVANEALNLKEIRAVFVIGAYNDGGVKCVGISARSDATYNVQLIMEKLGGGGHFSSAACKLQNVSVSEAKKQLNKILSLYDNDADTKTK